MTPEAMAELLGLLVEEGRPVGEDTLELARALRFEHEGSRVLLLAEARALAAAGRFEEALALLDGERAAAPGEDLEEALSATAAALTQALEDAPFLELALSGLPDEMPAPAREAVARRLSDLGFPNEAWVLRSATVPAAPAAPMPSEAASAAGTDAPLEPPALPMMASSPVTGRSPSPAAVAPPIAAAAPQPASGPAASTEPSRLTPAPPAAGTNSAGPIPLPFTDEPPGNASPPGLPPDPPMSLAERRALLARAADAAARAAVLLEQELSP